MDVPTKVAVDVVATPRPLGSEVVLVPGFRVE